MQQNLYIVQLQNRVKLFLHSKYISYYLSNKYLLGASMFPLLKSQREIVVCIERYIYYCNFPGNVIFLGSCVLLSVGNFLSVQCTKVMELNEINKTPTEGASLYFQTRSRRRRTKDTHTHTHTHTHTQTQTQTNNLVHIVRKFLFSISVLFQSYFF